MLLAGGLGTRLRPITGDDPKPLAALAAGVPMLRYVLSFWSARGARKFVLSLGYRAEAVQEALSAWSELSVELEIVKEQKPLGTGGAVLSALSVLPDQFFVINADTIVDVSLEALGRWHRARNWDASVVLSPRRERDQADGFEVSETGAVTAFVGRTRDTMWAYAGVCLLRRSLFEGLTLTSPASLEGDVFTQALAAGKRIGGARSRQPFHDLGTPERFLSFAARVRHGRVH